MIEKDVPLLNSVGKGFVVPVGNVNIVGVVVGNGLVGCGAFDVKAMDTFACPAAKVRPVNGPSVVTVDDVLSGIVKEANNAAGALGVKVGITGKEALDLLS